MPPEVTFYDEVAEYSFKVRRRVRIGLVAEREKTIHEGLRQHQVAKSQRGEEHLVETAREDHGARPVQPAQGRHGPSGEPEFTVVIIFNHLRTRTPRRREQRQAAFERHSHTQRKLVGRSHVHRLWLGTGAKGFGGVESVPIDGTGTSRAPALRKAAAAPWYAGSSIQTESPRFTRNLASRSSPCCAPETITISSGVQSTPREVPR